MSLLTNIVGYWKLDESSGDAADSTASANTLTNSNSVTYGAAVINNGADFGSANTNKQLSKTTNLGVGSGACTLAAWVNITTLPASGTTYGYVSLIDTTTQVNYMLLYKNNAGTPQIQFDRGLAGTADNFLSFNFTLTTGTWFHIVGTYDGANLNLYKNGSLVAGPQAGSGTGVDTQPSLFNIGNNFQNRWHSGKVDEVGVWSRALSSAEVTSLYNSGAGNQYPFTGAAVTHNYTLLGVGT